LNFGANKKIHSFIVCGIVGGRANFTYWSTCLVVPLVQIKEEVEAIRKVFL